MNTITVKSIIDTSKSYHYVDDGNPKRGGVKDVYFSPDRRYVVAFFRDPLDFNQKERIKRIVSLYLENIKKVMPPIISSTRFSAGPTMLLKKTAKQG